MPSLLSWLTNESGGSLIYNQNVIRILTVGSKKADLQEQALAIFSISLTHCIHIEPEWIPRKENEVADYLSRIVDYDDWSLDHNTFMELD